MEGKTANVVGSPDVLREHVYVPDAMNAVSRLARKSEAYGRFWIVPGPGPITMRHVMEIAAQHLGRRIKTRGAGLGMLRVVSLFDSGLREFLPMVPSYVAPAWFDGSALRELLGEIPVTPYEHGITTTLDWIATRGKPTA